MDPAVFADHADDPNYCYRCCGDNFDKLILFGCEVSVAAQKEFTRKWDVLEIFSGSHRLSDAFEKKGYAVTRFDKC
eukprot:4680164-Pyramimonas_sp.AAC.1